MNNWLSFKDIEELSQELLKDILSVAQKSIQLNGCFKIVLTGGVSIMHLYKLLSNAKSNWEKWYIYIGDERCLPLGDKDRNDYMINKIWLNNGLIPKENVYFMHAHLSVDNGTSHYKRVLRDVEDFDVVLLSMGDDGHVASLFPGHFYNDSQDVVIERNSPKYPSNRISMSYKRLNKSKNVFKIINGSLKYNAVKLWIDGVDLPISQVNGQIEKVYICKNSIKNYFQLV